MTSPKIIKSGSHQILSHTTQIPDNAGSTATAIFSAENGHEVETFRRICATKGCGSVPFDQCLYHGRLYCEDCYSRIVSDRAWRIKQIRKRRERIPHRIVMTVAALVGVGDAGLSATVPWGILWLIIAVQILALWGLIGLLKPLWGGK